MANVDELDHDSNDNTGNDNTEHDHLAAEAYDVTAQMSASIREPLRGKRAYWQPAEQAQQDAGTQDPDGVKDPDPYPQLADSKDIGTIMDTFDLDIGPTDHADDTDPVPGSWVRLVYEDGRDILVPSTEVICVSPATSSADAPATATRSPIPATAGRMSGLTD